MNAAREALLLPLIFLTIVWLGGFRPGATTSLAPPPVLALVLGLLLLRVVVQSGALAPHRLLSAGRTTLANANGVVVILTLWVAASQTIAMVIPASGLPRVTVSVFLFVLLLNTAAAAPDRLRLFRSLAVTFGAAFLLKYVVLNELSTPGESRLQRMLHAVMDSVTLGVLVQEVQRPIAGYLALGVILLFLFGVFLLPARPPGGLARRPGPARLPP
jgi:hypothetical protein